MTRFLVDHASPLAVGDEVFFVEGEALALGDGKGGCCRWDDNLFVERMMEDGNVNKG